MDLNITQQVAALQRLTVKQLRQKYMEVFGEETNGHNKVWLIRRIAWRLQSLTEGGISERAQLRASAIACEADLRMSPPRLPVVTPPEATTTTRTFLVDMDRRLPPLGSVLTRKYKEHTVQVTILADGFDYQGTVYPSLSAVAKAITGNHCNGYLFFRLGPKGDKR